MQKRNADDILIYNNEIRPYIPEKIFDAHTHLCKRELHEYHSDLDGLYNLSNDVGMSELENCWKTLLPDSEIKTLLQYFRGFLFFEKGLYLSVEMLVNAVTACSFSPIRNKVIPL